MPTSDHKIHENQSTRSTNSVSGSSKCFITVMYTDFLPVAPQESTPSGLLAHPSKLLNFLTILVDFYFYFPYRLSYTFQTPHSLKTSAPVKFKCSQTCPSHAPGLRTLQVSPPHEPPTRSPQGSSAQIPLRCRWSKQSRIPPSLFSSCHPMMVPPTTTIRSVTVSKIISYQSMLTWRTLQA